MTQPLLSIDLDDGLPPTVQVRIERPKGPGAPRFAAPPSITITSTPVAVVISYAQVHCLGCGAIHKDHRGIFLECLLSNKVRALSRKSLRELTPYLALPRRVDEAPKEAIPICSDCWHVEASFRDAVAAATVEPEIFDPLSPVPMTQVIEVLEEKAVEGQLEIQEEL